MFASASVGITEISRLIISRYAAIFAVLFISQYSFHTLSIDRVKFVYSADFIFQNVHQIYRCCEIPHNPVKEAFGLA